MNIPLPEKVEYILKTLEAAGYPGFAVGGCIRDSLMGKTPDDWDICTSALPGEVLRIFGEKRVVETGLKHGTVTLLLDREPFEITTYRTEGLYRDCRHPEKVSFVKNVEEDLSRRDFTVNAMAYNPANGLVDLFGGTRDLEKGVIRCVGDPEKRFSEDALRILRALRFASVLGFNIEEKTVRAAKALKGLLKNISAERINAELTKLLGGKNRRKILLDFPEIFEEILPQPFGGDWENAVENALNARDLLTCKSVLLHFLYRDPEGVRLAMRALKSDNLSTDFAVNFSRFFGHPEATDLPSARKAVRDIGFDTYYAIIAFKQNHKTLKLLDEIKQKKLCCFVGELDLKGTDLLALGLTGKDIGETMQQLLNDVIEEKVPNRKTELINYAKKLIETDFQKNCENTQNFRR